MRFAAVRLRCTAVRSGTATARWATGMDARRLALAIPDGLT